jgi:hypothetical protein
LGLELELESGEDIHDQRDQDQQWDDYLVDVILLYAEDQDHAYQVHHSDNTDIDEVFQAQC